MWMVRGVSRPSGRVRTSRACGWVACLVLAAPILVGCDAAMYPGASGGSELGVERTFSGVTMKTFAAPIGSVGTAALQSLNYMDIGLTEVRKKSETWDIAASAGKRAVDIHLEAVTPKATLMRVTVDQGDPFVKDGATATEIVLQTSDALTTRANFNAATQTAAQPAADPAPVRTRRRAKKTARGF